MDNLMDKMMLTFIMEESMLPTMPHRIQIFYTHGKFITMFDEGGEGDGQFHKASALSIDSEGNLYIAYQFNFRIKSSQATAHS